MCAVHRDFLPKNTVWKEGKNNSMRKKLNKHSLSQMISIKFNMINYTDCIWNFTSMVFLQKPHNPRLAIRKTSDKSQLMDSYKIPGQYFLNLLRSSKSRSEKHV